MCFDQIEFFKRGFIIDSNVLSCPDMLQWVQEVFTPFIKATLCNFSGLARLEVASATALMENNCTDD